jgi:hypothetical protein
VRFYLEDHVIAVSLTASVFLIATSVDDESQLSGAYAPLPAFFDFVPLPNS